MINNRTVVVLYVLTAISAVLLSTVWGGLDTEHVNNDSSEASWNVPALSVYQPQKDKEIILKAKVWRDTPKKAEKQTAKEQGALHLVGVVTVDGSKKAFLKQAGEVKAFQVGDKVNAGEGVIDKIETLKVEVVYPDHREILNLYQQQEAGRE